MHTLINLFNYLYYDLTCSVESSKIENKRTVLIEYLKTNTFVFDDGEPSISYIGFNVFNIGVVLYHVLDKYDVIERKIATTILKDEYVKCFENGKPYYIKYGD